MNKFLPVLLAVALQLGLAYHPWTQAAEPVQPPKPKPANLEQALSMLDALLSQERRDEIRDKDEFRAVMEEHMDGIGLFIRNHWLRSGDRRLFSQLQGFTAGAYDGMSTVIMQAYWHRLRGLPYDPKSHGACFHVDYPAVRPGVRSAASAAQYADYVQKLACK